MHVGEVVNTLVGTYGNANINPENPTSIHPLHVDRVMHATEAGTKRAYMEVT
jgi:hypothetical protein